MASGSLHVGLFALALAWGQKSLVTPSEPMQIEIFESSMPIKSHQISSQNLTPTVVQDDSNLITKTEALSVPSASEPQSTGVSQSGTKDSYTKDLLVLIHQRKVYPRLAQKMGQKGRLMALLRVASDGRILESQIVEKTPYVALNEAAEKLVKSLPTLKPFPNSIHEKEWVFHIPIDYRIE